MKRRKKHRRAPRPQLPLYSKLLQKIKAKRKCSDRDVATTFDVNREHITRLRLGHKRPSWELERAIALHAKALKIRVPKEWHQHLT